MTLPGSFQIHSSLLAQRARVTQAHPTPATFLTLFCRRSPRQGRNFRSLWLCALLTVLSACTGGESSSSSTVPIAAGTQALASALAGCKSISRTQSPAFTAGPSTFDSTDTIRDTIQAPQPIVNGVSLYIPDVSTQPLIGCGYVDPTAAPYNADPTGVQDSTAALNNALDFARRNFLVVYVPSGTYVLTNTIECVQRQYHRDSGRILADREGACVLVGSRTGSRPQFVLKNNALGFGSSGSPKPMISFWGLGETGTLVPPLPHTSSTYNQSIENIDFVVGNNPGGVAVKVIGAQGCLIHDVTIDATGAYAGVLGAVASGGSVVNLTVIGGQYGIYADESHAGRPVPTLANITLLDQTISAIVQGNDTIETMVLVGAKIRLAPTATGPAMKVKGGAANAGLLTIIDSQIEFAAAATSNVALETNHSTHLSNVYVRGAGSVVKGTLTTTPTEPAPAALSEWSWLQSLTLSVRPSTTNINGVIVQIEMPLYVNGVPLTQTREAVIGAANTAPPADLQSRHGWTTSFPWSDSAGAVNVKLKYGAVGDGATDDTTAIQNAIDAEEIVFFPKGYYLVSRTLHLKPNTKLVGVSRVLSVIVAANAGDFAASTPQPIIKTADDAEAETVISNMGIYVPVFIPGAFAVDWRAGDKSVWRSTEAILFFTNGYRSGGPQVIRSAPLVQLSGNAGGRWYAFEEGVAVPAGSSDYRMLRIRGTQRPLRFYHLDPEHKDYADAYVSIENSHNVAVFGLKGEEEAAIPVNTILLWITGSNQLSIFGAGGMVAPNPDDGTATPPSLYRIDNSTDFRLVSLMDRLADTSNTGNTITVSERFSVGTPVHTSPLERPILYARDPTPWSAVAPPRRGP